VDTLDDQLVALENVLALEPDNEKARKGLEVVKQKIADRDKPKSGSATPSSTKSTATASTSGGNLAQDPAWSAFLTGTESSSKDKSSPKNDPFAGTGFSGGDPWQTSNSSSSDPAFSGMGGWDDLLKAGSDSSTKLADSLGLSSTKSAPSTPSTPPPPSSSSVEWGKSDSPTPARQVPQPSTEQYDDWISNLGLGGTKATAKDPFSANADATPPASAANNWSDLTGSADPFASSGAFPTTGSSLGEGWTDFLSGSDTSANEADPFGSGGSGASTLGEGWEAFVSQEPFGSADTAAAPRGASALGEGWSDIASQDDDEIPDAFMDMGSPRGRSSSAKPAAKSAYASPLKSPFEEDEDDDPFGDISSSSDEAFLAELDDDNPFDDSFLGEMGRSKQTAPTKGKKLSAKDMAFFAQIPAEIPKVSAKSSSAGGIVINFLLILLNLAALGGIIVQLMG
jgi:hypothetical protein